MQDKKYLPQLIIFLAAVLLYIPFIGSVHLFDWDEINFAESAREMLVTGDFLTVQINFEPFWEKPPLFIWFQVLSMKIFGVNEFAARFPNAICGIATLLFLFSVGKKLINKNFAIWWVVGYGASILPFLYFKSGIIDPWFNLFIFAGIYYMYAYLYWDANKIRNLILSAISIGLAVLTKGPVGFLLFGLTLIIFVSFKKFKFYFKWIDVLIFTATFAFVGGFWFILQIVNGNFTVIHDFILYQIRLFKTEDAGHGGFLLYHFIVVFVGVFPISIFALKSFSSKVKTNVNASFSLMMKILLWVVLVLFTLVKTKIVHYSSMAYFPLTFLGAQVIYRIDSKELQFNKWMFIPLGLISLIYGMLISAFPIVDRYKDEIIASGLITDEFAMGNMQARVNWTGWEPMAGLFIIIGFLVSFYFFKKGNSRKSIVALFIGTLIFSYSTLTNVVPRIEKYSQHAAIAFFKKHKDEDCYMETMYYKSYAHLFYGNKQAPDNYKKNKQSLLREGDIDKPVYFIMKNTNEKRFFEEYPKAKKMYEKNGFVMAKREKNGKEHFPTP